jgi:myo-inositol catabolism protein IolC
VYSQTRDLRALGFRHGLWTLDPTAEPGDLWKQVEDAVKRRDAWQAIELLYYIARQPDIAVPHGQFTVAASVALSFYAHMLPFKVLLAKNLLRLSIQ